jgi:sporulation-control protein spo0M
MSFFKKIKQGLGIATAKVELEVPGTIPKTAEEIQGRVTVTAKSDQKVTGIKVRLVERTEVGSGEDKQVHVNELASVELEDVFEIKEGEVQTRDFAIPLPRGKSGGVSFNIFGGTLSISGSSSNRVEVFAKVDLEGVAIDPSDRKAVRFT